MNAIQVLLELKNKLTGQMGTAIAKLQAQKAQMQGLSNQIGFNQVKAMKAAQSEIPLLSRGLELVTNKYALMATGIVALGGVLYKATSMAAEWDKSMSKLNVTAHLKPAQLKALGNEFLEMGKRIPVELDNIPRAFEKLISSGMDTNTAKKAIEPVLMAAKANQAEVDVVASALANVMASSGNNNAKQVMDILQQTQKIGNAEFQDIAAYLPKIIPVARAAGVSLQDVSAQFAFLTAKGMKTEQVSTALENMMLAFTDSNIKKNFKGIGINLYDKGKLKDTTAIIDELKAKMQGLSDEGKNAVIDKLGLNQQAGLAIKNMLNDTKTLKQTTLDMQNPVGALKQAYDDSFKPMDAVLLLWNSIKATMIQVGQTIWDYIAPPLKWIADNRDTIANVFNVIAHAILGAGIALAAFNAKLILTSIWTGIVSVATGVATAAQRLWNIAMAANPIGAIITAIGVLVGLAVWAYNKFDTFRARVLGWFAGIKSVFSNIGTLFIAVGKMITGVFSFDATLIKSGWNDFTTVFKQAGTAGQEEYKKQMAQANKPKTTEDPANPGGLQEDPAKPKPTSSPSPTTDSATKTGGSAKSIVINIAKLASIDLKTTLEKNTANDDLEKIINQTLIKALRNIETSY